MQSPELLAVFHCRDFIYQQDPALAYRTQHAIDRVLGVLRSESEKSLLPI
ncbi:MAG: hypothetical protein AB4352_27450 [Hormoscilla sp.]